MVMVFNRWRTVLQILLVAAVGARAGVARAAISQPAGWTQQYAGTTYPSGLVGAAVPMPAGSSRLLVVAISSRRTTQGTQTVYVSYGGRALTLAQGNAGTSAMDHTYVYYLDEAGIAAASSADLSATVSGGTSGYTWVHAAVFEGVDQTTPIRNSQQWTRTSAQAGVGPFTASLSMNANDWPFEVILLDRAASSTAATVQTWATAWGTNGGTVEVNASYATSPALRTYVARRAVPTADTTDASGHTASASVTSAMTGITLGAAPSVVIGNGTSEPGNANLVMGATDGLDAFQLSTSSGTANVTGIDVTFTAGGTAAATVSINSSASCTGTSYGSVAGPLTNTGTVSVPMAPSLSVGTTATSYYVCITAGQVSTSTPVTGTVSAVTAVGSGYTDNDTTSSTLTVNPVPSITIGTGTGEPANRSIPQNGVAALDVFTLTAPASNVSVTSVTVDLGNGTALGSASIQNTSACDQTTPYGTLASPVGGSNVIPTSGLAIATATTSFWICVTGGSVAIDTVVSGRVTAVAATGYGATGTDSSTTQVTVTAPAAAGPTISIVNPRPGAVVSAGGATGQYRVQVRVYLAGGISGVTGVTLSTNGGTTFPVPMTRNSSYDTGSLAKATVYEATIAGPATGSYTLAARATSSSATSTSEPVAITVVAARAGNGNLLVRDDSSQLCTDCHALHTHSSESTGPKYGSWAVQCRDCHTPHATRDAFLVRESITPPTLGGAAQAPRNVGFTATTGDSNAPGWDGVNSRPTSTASYVNSDNTGPCQVCHTRTENPSSHVARWRKTGNADGHYTAAAGTSACTGCHPHGKGFAAGESSGGASCSGCHRGTWNVVTGAVAGIVSRHALGSTPGTNDAFTDVGTDWSGVATLDAVLPAQRSCVSMCHDDHVHDASGVTTHDYDVYRDARTAASRAMTRDPSGNVNGGAPARADFTAGVAPYGMCASCHQKPVSSTRPAIDGAAFDASAHDFASNAVGATTYAWTYTLHDGSTFDRDCTKCHASRTEGTTPASTGAPSAVHGTSDPVLLAGTKTPAGAAAGFVCYNCHGTTASPADGAQGNRSGKDIQGQIAHATTAGASGHPADSDAAHDTATELANAAFGNALGGAARHSSCLDCHDAHRAKAGTHAIGTNAAGPPLQGAWGAKLSSNPPFWTAPTSASFTKTTLVAGTDLEATLCFKCHSSYSWGTGTAPTSPSGTFAEKDTAMEFNPNNTGNFAGTWASGETAGGFHPVLASAGSNLGAVNLSNLVTTNLAWSTTARNLMTCTDCHESDTTTDPNGPHGSAAKFVLRGPNTGWSATTTMTASGMPAGTFCANCHSPTFASSRFTQHYSRDNHRVACWNCHAAIPHGGPRPGMLVAIGGACTASGSAGGNSKCQGNVGGVIAGWDRTAPYAGLPAGSSSLYIMGYPTTSTGSWGQNNCGCGTSGGH